jgi:hypothetical protein
MVVTKYREGKLYIYHISGDFTIAGIGYPKDTPQIRYRTYLDLDTTRITL